jgi:hypothetical protein
VVAPAAARATAAAAPAAAAAAADTITLFTPSKKGDATQRKADIDLILED